MTTTPPPLTTEAAFHRAIDADPEDRTVRLVYAEYLEEIGDERAAVGHRAILDTGRKAYPDPDFCPWFTWGTRWEVSPEYLPKDWFDAIELRGKKMGFAPYHGERDDCPL